MDESDSSGFIPALVSLAVILTCVAASSDGRALESTASYQPSPSVQTQQPVTQSQSIRNLPQRQLVDHDVIEVELSDRVLCYLGECYSVIIGSPELPTPIGTFRLERFECIGGCTMLGLGFKRGYIPGIGAGFYAIHDVPSHFTKTWGCIGTHPDLQAYLLANVTERTILVIQE